MNSLIKERYIYSVRGAGTFVADFKNPKKLKKAFIIDDYRSSDANIHGALSMRIASEIQQTRECKIVHPDEIKLHLGEVVKPGNAVIWIRPVAANLAVVEYLANGGVPQLLVGRSYLPYNHITTDAAAGIKNGLQWMKESGVKRVAFITRENNPMLPYIAERQIAFFHSCLELGLAPIPDNIFFLSDKDVSTRFNEISKRLFAKKRCPEGIFIASIETVLPILSLAESYGKKVGRDFKLLTFDAVEALNGTDGVCMLPQRWGRMGKVAVEWFFKHAIKNEKYIVKIEPKMID